MKKNDMEEKISNADEFLLETVTTIDDFFQRQLKRFKFIKLPIFVENTIGFTLIVSLVVLFALGMLIYYIPTQYLRRKFHPNRKVKDFQEWGKEIRNVDYFFHCEEREELHFMFEIDKQKYSAILYEEKNKWNLEEIVHYESEHLPCGCGQNTIRGDECLFLSRRDIRESLLKEVFQKQRIKMTIKGIDVKKMMNDLKVA